MSTRTKKYSVRDLPEVAQKVQKSRNVISFVTTEFLVKDELIKKVVKDISNISNLVLDELLVEVRGEIAFLYQLSETISSLDLLLSLAKVSMNQDYICPKFGDEIAVRQGRHPILDTMPLDIVSNDIKADPFSRLHVLTGPNMSGKSTFLRQVLRCSLTECVIKLSRSCSCVSWHSWGVECQQSRRCCASRIASSQGSPTGTALKPIPPPSWWRCRRLPSYCPMSGPLPW